MLASYDDADTIPVNRPSIPNPTKLEVSEFISLASDLLSVLEGGSIQAGINKLCINPTV